MDIEDAQREVRSVFIGGFCGHLVSSVIWLVSAALGTWHPVWSKNSSCPLPNARTSRQAQVNDKSG
jgi:hypothetical protein